MNFETLFFPVIFLFGAISLSFMTKALRTLGRRETKKEFHKKRHYYYIHPLLRKLYPKDKWESLFFFISCPKFILRFLYAATGLLYLLSVFAINNKIGFGENGHLFVSWSYLILSLVIIVGIPLILDFLIGLIVHFAPYLTLRSTSFLASLFILLFFPISFLLYKIQKGVYPLSKLAKKSDRSLQIRDKLLELVYESDLSQLLEPIDRKILIALASFRNRIAREIMIPRINIFAVPLHLKVEEAAKLLIVEEYSRVPVYHESRDNIVGVLLYKDLFNLFVESQIKEDPSLLETPIQKLITPIIYTPETKRISELLQEFKAKKIHLAIVVDEYGGTEGIVTIEDILEELVGEILDEYDYEDQALFKQMPGGGYIIDAKMSIVDLEKELGFTLPSSSEYDSIGGYIYHKAGSIPPKGWRIHSDAFDMEVIASNDRAVEKVWIIPSKTEME